MSLAARFRNTVLSFMFHLLVPAAVSAGSLSIDDPAYAKWGQLAVEKAKTQYEASVMDYLHVGRYTISPTVTEERFKLWLKRNGREFGVYVFVRFDTATEQLISIHFRQAK